MNLLQDVITYVRRIIKAPSNAIITDALIIDYINRFWIMDVDARIQLFDLKKVYQFQTVPGFDQYNMPLYDIQTEEGPQNINFYPVYQVLQGSAYINGVEVPLETQRNVFFNMYPKIVQQLQIVGQGNGGAGPYNLSFPVQPSNANPLNPPIQYILRGHVDMQGIIATGSNEDPPLVTILEITNNQNFIQSIPVTSVYPAVYITSTAADGANIIASDSGQFIDGNQNLGLLMSAGNAPNGNLPLPNNYLTSFPITGATNTNPVVLTASTSYQSGQIIEIFGVGGMIELNGGTFTVISSTPTTVTINVDGTSFGVYTSGGTITSIQNIINYFDGTVTNLYFPASVPNGANINAQFYLYQSGLPRAILIYDNVITLRSPPDRQYLVEIEVYMTPAAFLMGSNAIPFAYMSEYIARGAARKILADTGDVEQFQFYEPFFREQEMLVWKRSQRQFTATRTQTIYSNPGLGHINQSYSGQ